MRTACLMTALLVCWAGAARAEDPNVLTPDEKRLGFQLLFNGRDLAGWQHNGNWTVEDAALTRREGGGGITYAERAIPADFELRFEWKVAQGSNSGVYYRPGQYEYQILDNQSHADGKNPRTSAASLYFCMAPCEDHTKRVGEWNRGSIICQGTLIQHWLNGRKVVHFDYTDPKWAWNVELLRKRGADLADRGAQLMLQDHGDPVWYRGIKLRALSARDKLDSTPVQPAEIPPAVLRAEAEKLERILSRRRAARSKAPKPE